MIQTKADELPDPTFVREAHQERNVIGRLSSRLEQWWRIATHDKKRAATDKAMLTIAALLLWLQLFNFRVLHA